MCRVGEGEPSAAGPQDVKRFGSGAGVAAAACVLVGASLYGDTPDTRDTNAEVARYFVEHRASVMRGAVVSSFGLMLMLVVVAKLVDGLAEAGQRQRSVAVQASGTIVAVFLLASTHLVLAALSYVIGAEAPAVSKGLFELTLVAAPISAVPLAAFTWHVGTGLRRANLGRRWFANLSIAAALAFALVACGYAQDGPLSPDVGQQVVILLFVTWLAVSDLGLRSVASSHS